MKYANRIEIQLADGRWMTIERNETRDYCLGYLDARKDGPSPRKAFRAVRYPADMPLPAFHTSPADTLADGEKVLAAIDARSEIGVGMLPQAFGYQWPAYLGASVTALKRAAMDIRAHADRHPAEDIQALATLASDAEVLLTRLRTTLEMP